MLGDFVDLRRTTIESLRRLVELAATRQPTALVFDDLHRAHPELVNLAGSVAAPDHPSPRQRDRGRFDERGAVRLVGGKAHEPFPTSVAPVRCSRFV